jgi:hypothetical protein
MAYARTAVTEMLIRELGTLGLSHRIEKTNRGHLRFTFAHRGVERSLIASGTPSDWRAPRAARAQLRRMVRQIEKRDS